MPAQKKVEPMVPRNAQFPRRVDRAIRRAARRRKRSILQWLRDAVLDQLEREGVKV